MYFNRYFWQGKLLVHKSIYYFRTSLLNQCDSFKQHCEQFQLQHGVQYTFEFAEEVDNFCSTFNFFKDILIYYDI